MPYSVKWRKSKIEFGDWALRKIIDNLRRNILDYWGIRPL